MFGSLLPIFAATDAATDGSGDGKQPSGLTVFPGEEPSDEETRNWLKLNLPILRRGYGSAIRDVTPLHLVK